MKLEEFQEGIGILQAAFGRKYSDDRVKLLWNEFGEKNGCMFLKACNTLKTEGTKLPILPEIIAVFTVILDEERRENERISFSAPAPPVTQEEFEGTSKMLRETTLKLKSKAQADGR